MGGPKKQIPTLLSVTSPNANRFSQFFHWQTRQLVDNKVRLNYLTTPCKCRYTTLWNIRVQKIAVLCMVLPACVQASVASVAAGERVYTRRGHQRTVSRPTVHRPTPVPCRYVQASITCRAACTPSIRHYTGGARLWVRHSDMLSRGWNVNTRAKLECDISKRDNISECNTNDRAPSVLSYDQQQ